MIAAGHALEERGHTVIFVVDPGYAGLVRAEGFEIRPAAPVVDSAVRQRLLERYDRLHVRRSASGDPLLARLLGQAELTQQLIAGFEGVELAAFSSHHVAARTAAEVLKLPWVTLAASPEYALREHLLGAGWPDYLARMRRFDSRFNAVRREHQLPGQRDGFALRGFSDRLVCIMASAICIPRRPEWPSHFKLVGYASWDRPRQWLPPRGLARFLAGGTPPVVLSVRPRRRAAGKELLEVAIRALDRIGRRVVLLTGLPFGVGRPDKAAEGDVISSKLAAWDYVPLSLLLPESSALVHHGGIGSMSAAIRHGRPALVLPAIADQHYNAQRTVDLGAGRSLDLAEAGVRRFSQELDAILMDPGYGRRASALGKRMEAEDAPGRAASDIEAALQRPRIDR